MTKQSFILSFYTAYSWERYNNMDIKHLYFIHTYTTNMSNLPKQRDHKTSKIVLQCYPKPGLIFFGTLLLTKTNWDSGMDK